MQKKWLVKTPKERKEVDELRTILKVDPIVAELLLQREIDTYDKALHFFRPSINDLHDPFLMKNMKEAVKRLEHAFDKNQKILLYGDYDVDGTTAVALMFSFLRKHYTNIDYYIPDRYTEGYGVSRKGVEFAKDNNFSLIISLDCGIKSIDHVEYAKELGIDFIICDHHNPGDTVPNAFVLDPKQKDCPYPFKELSGCGVGFKLLQALCSNLKWNQNQLFEYLDLLALSIGADIVPITGENRILCHHGLARMNADPRMAFQALVGLAKKEWPLTLTDLVFTIAPRINAVGRLRSGKIAVALMISEDEEEIQEIAQEIHLDNEERRNIDQTMTQQALAMIEDNEILKNAKSTILYNPEWHKGVVGIVASRLIETHYRPTIVLTLSNGLVTGSARTIANFDIHVALEKCSHLLEQFGGHTHAAGLSMKPEKLESFQMLFEKIVEESLGSEDLIPEQNIDLEMSFKDLFRAEENRMQIPRLKRILMQFEPHGPENMKPVFLAKNVYATKSTLLKNAHLKLSLTQTDGDLQIEGIGFNMADKMYEVASGMPFDVAFTLEINRWNNRETVQLNIKDIRSTL